MSTFPRVPALMAPSASHLAYAVTFLTIHICLWQSLQKNSAARSLLQGVPETSILTFHKKNKKCSKCFLFVCLFVSISENLLYSNLCTLYCLAVKKKKKATKWKQSSAMNYLSLNTLFGPSKEVIPQSRHQRSALICSLLGSDGIRFGV